MSQTPTLTFAGDHVLVRHKHQSTPQMARILGREVRDGSERIYLDTRLHRPGSDVFGEWSASGAITSILEREVSTVATEVTTSDNDARPAVDVATQGEE